jgi:hypothetical protein
MGSYGDWGYHKGEGIANHLQRMTGSKFLASSTKRGQGGQYVCYAAVEYAGKVYGHVFLVNFYHDNGATEFVYKPIDETMGPFYFDCPVNILRLLSPLPKEGNDNARAWRAKCWRVARKAGREKAFFSSLSVGSIVKLPECLQEQGYKFAKLVDKKRNVWEYLYTPDQTHGNAYHCTRKDMAGAEKI